MSHFQFEVFEGDSLKWLRELASNSIDSCVTDPPGGINWMHTDWDSDKGGRDSWVAWLADIMKEVYRVVKPGGHCLVWALPRQSYWTALALDKSGWEIRDQLTHIFASGFPKSLDVGKQIDKMAGAERETTGRVLSVTGNRAEGSPSMVQSGLGAVNAGLQAHMETIPATDAAQEWDGWGTALKPACEYYILARKPISERNVAANVLKWGTGALNIDATRVRRESDDVPGWHKTGSYGRTAGYLGTDTFKIRDMPPEEVQQRCGSKGRWTPHLLLSHSEGCQQVGERQIKGCPQTVIQGGKEGGGYDVGSSDGTRHGVFEGYGDEKGMETVDVWECAPDCPIGELNRQSGVKRSGRVKTFKPAYEGESTTGFVRGHSHPGNQYADSGGASRFFPTFLYQPKPSRREKDLGLEGLDDRILNRVNPGGLENEPRFAPVTVKNNHSTVKSIDLCRWLIRLITRPGGIVVDPFCGSGSIGCAAVLQGCSFIGIDEKPEYCEIARARIDYWSKKT